jgi:hypothetical protein
MSPTPKATIAGGQIRSKSVPATFAAAARCIGALGGKLWVCSISAIDIIWSQSRNYEVRKVTARVARPLPALHKAAALT